MKTNKMISALLAAAQIFTLSVVPGIASAETTNVGLIYCQEAEEATDWVLGNKISKAEESTEGYQKYLPTATDSTSMLKIPMGENKIKFEDDKVIVIETKIKAKKNTQIASGNSRLSLVYNAGITVEDLDNAKAISKGNTKQSYSQNGNHGVLIQLYEGVGASTFNIGFAKGSYVSDDKNYCQTALGWDKSVTANTLDGTNEYTLIAKLDKPGNKAEITVKKDGTKIAEDAVTDLGWITTSDFLENIAFNSIINPFDYFEVDYVKVYNMPEANADDYADACWQTELQKVTSEILGGEDVSGTLTFTKDESFSVKFNVEMNEETVTADTVYILDGDLQKVNAEVKYDKDNKIITITPEPKLVTGSYTLVLTDGVKTKAEYPSSAADLGFSGKEFPFYYNATGVPVASEVTFEHKGTGVEARFTYYHEDGLAEGEHKYQWMKSDSQNGKFEDIDGEESAYTEYPENSDGIWYKVKVIPVDANGSEGAVLTSEAYAGPTSPVAENVRIAGQVVGGKTLTAVFDYTDANEYDKEGEHKYQWYINSLENENEFTPIEGATEKTYSVPTSAKGLKFMVGVTPVSKEAPNNAKEVKSEATSEAVESILSATNLVQESDFESGKMTGWSEGTNGGIDGQGTSSKEIITKEEAEGNVYAGNNSMKIQLSKNYFNWGFTATVEGKTVYIVRTAAKSDGGTIPTQGWRFWGRSTTGDSASYKAAPGAGCLWKDIIKGGSGLTVSSTWQIFEDFMVTYKDATDLVQFYTDKGATFYLDDVYFGKLIVDGIEGLKIPESVNIPESGKTTSVSLGNPKLLNQLGTETGLTHAKTSVRVSKGSDYAEIIENNGVYSLVVKDNALVGDIELEVGFIASENHEMYHNTNDYMETYKVSLIGTGNKTPKVTNATITGKTAKDSIITLNYDFYQEDGDADKSEITWYYKSTPEGEYSVIPGVSGKTYKVTSETENGYFRVSVLPKTADATGTLVYTNEVGAPTAPLAKNVKITGNSFIGETLTVEYEFYDLNMDEEGETEFAWLRADTEGGTYVEIKGANSKTYVLTEDDIDKFIKVSVKPVSLVAPEVGETETVKVAIPGPATPIASNLSVKKEGNRYVGSYDYYQMSGAPQGESTYRWIIGTTVVSTAITYVPEFTGTKTVTFEVTPVASKEPSIGKPVSIDVRITGGKSSGGGSSSGGSPSFVGAAIGSGTLVQSPVTSITTPEVEKDLTLAGKLTDIKGHWAYDAIRWAVNGEIMEPATDSTFDPNSYATRESVIRYMAKLLGWETTEYQGIFEDVDGEFGDILQTFVDKGVISVDTKFRPDDSLTREELCKIFALSLGIVSQNKDTTVFADTYAMGTWAIPHINAMYEAGFVNGVGENLFSPKGTLTRAQMATLLERAKATVEEAKAAELKALEEAAETDTIEETVEGEDVAIDVNDETTSSEEKTSTDAEEVVEDTQSAVEAAEENQEVTE